MQAHINKREIANEEMIFWLFIEEGLKFAARQPPTFHGGIMLASDLLRPAKPETKFAVEIAHRWVRPEKDFFKAGDDRCGTAFQDALINLSFQGNGVVGRRMKRGKNR